MKIVKTASGKTIKLSKKDWEVIGKRAGWMAEAQAAPAKAPVKAPTKAPTKAPNKKPGKQDPFRPPKITPAPAKAKKKLTNKEDDSLDVSLAHRLSAILRISQTYEEGALAPVRNFWMDIPQDHPFSQHPILSEYGHNLSRDGYDYIVGKMGEGDGQVPQNQMEAGMEVQGLMKKIFDLEATHEEQLVNAAKDITAEIWGIDRNMLNADIGQNPEPGDENQDPDNPEDPEANLLPMTPELKKEVDKRIMMNTLTQGSSVHAMYSVHHMVADIINGISPELLSLYTRMSGLATHQFYIIDIPAIIQMMQAQLGDNAVGWSHIEKEEGGEAEGPEGQQQAPEPKIVASAICFPILCQELFKGVMELIAHHGEANLTEEEVRTVYHYADRLEDEPWLMTVGPALWRKLLEALPQGVNMSEVIMKLNQEDPDKVTNVMRSIIQNPDAAKAYFNEIKEIEDVEEVELWQDAEEPVAENLGNGEEEDDDDAWLNDLANQ